MTRLLLSLALLAGCNDPWKIGPTQVVLQKCANVCGAPPRSVTAYACECFAPVERLVDDGGAR